MVCASFPYENCVWSIEIDKVDNRILVATKTEPLNDPLSLKLWSRVARYIGQHGGPNFVRSAIIEKLQRIADKPSPAVCNNCINLTKQDGEPFCLVLVEFLQRKHLKEKWNCEYFRSEKEL